MDLFNNFFVYFHSLTLFVRKNKYFNGNWINFVIIGRVAKFQSFISCDIYSREHNFLSFLLHNEFPHFYDSFLSLVSFVLVYLGGNCVFVTMKVNDHDKVDFPSTNIFIAHIRWIKKTSGWKKKNSIKLLLVTMSKVSFFV